MTAIRSIIFNILFYGLWTPFVCISMMPCLLMSRAYAVKVAAMYQSGAYYLAKYILDLDYELRGEQHRPPHGTAYLVASKHSSAYETLLLYRLFNDPTIVLKKELLDLPVFGWFLKKVEVIAIDRGNRNSAMQSLYSGAQKMKDQNRPIVIFPQGTRVPVDVGTEGKPYKAGITKLYAELNIPVLPMAINTGLYWPRNSFWKKSGRTIVEFLPVIEPGLPPAEVLKTLETQIEYASQKLVEEARNKMVKA